MKMCLVWFILILDGKKKRKENNLDFEETQHWQLLSGHSGQHQSSNTQSFLLLPLFHCALTFSVFRAVRPPQEEDLAAGGHRIHFANKSVFSFMPTKRGHSYQTTCFGLWDSTMCIFLGNLSSGGNLIESWTWNRSLVCFQTVLDASLPCKTSSRGSILDVSIASLFHNVSIVTLKSKCLHCFQL